MCTCCSFKPKTLRISNGLCTILAILILVAMLVAGLVSQASYTSGIHFYEAAINWYREVIIDVTVVDPATGKCTGDKQDVFDYKFKGLSKGCDCTASSGQVTTGTCSASQSTCSNVSKIDQTILQNWVDSSSNGIRLCFQRLPNYKYYKKYLTTSSCRDPATEKMCGGTDPLYAFCVPTASNCPVQSIGTSQTDPSDTQIGTTGLWIKRNIANVGHLSEANVGNTGICYTTQYLYSASPSTQYKLLQDDMVTCTLDPKYQQIQQINAADFFTANSLPASTFPGLTTGSKMSLFGRKYIQWNMSCRTGNDFEDIIDVAMNFADDYNMHVNFSKIAGANLAVIAVYGVFLFLGCFTTDSSRKCCSFKNCCKFDLCCCCKSDGCSFSGCFTFRSPQCIRRWWIRKDYEPSCKDYFFLVDPLHVLLIIVKFVLDIAMIVISLVNISKVKSYSGEISDLAKKSCSDSMVNASLQTTSDNINNIVAPADMAIVVIMIIYTFISFIAICTYQSELIAQRRKILKQKMDRNNSHSLQESDQTLPSISSKNNLYDNTNKSGNNDGRNPEIQMQNIAQNQPIQDTQIIIPPNQPLNPIAAPNYPYPNQPPPPGYYGPPQSYVPPNQQLQMNPYVQQQPQQNFGIQGNYNQQMMYPMQNNQQQFQRVI